MGQPIVDLDGVGAVCFDFPDVPLLDGSYDLSLAITSRAGGTVYDRSDASVRFEVMQPGAQRGRVALQPKVVHFFHGEVPEPPEPVAT